MDGSVMLIGIILYVCNQNKRVLRLRRLRRLWRIRRRLRRGLRRGLRRRLRRWTWRWLRRITSLHSSSPPLQNVLPHLLCSVLRWSFLLGTVLRPPFLLCSILRNSFLCGAILRTIPLMQIKTNCILIYSKCTSTRLCIYWCREIDRIMHHPDSIKNCFI